jgi:hypothetical protein
MIGVRKHRRHDQRTVLRQSFQAAQALSTIRRAHAKAAHPLYFFS